MEPNIFDKVHDVDLKIHHGEVLYRLCHERYRCTGPAGCAGRFKAGTAPCTLLNDRVEQRAG